MIPDEEDGPFLSKTALYFLKYVNVYDLFLVNQGLNTFCRKGYPGRGSSLAEHWGLSGYFITTENSRFLCNMTDCHDLLSGVSLLCVLGPIEPDWELVSRLLIPAMICPRVLNLLQPYQFCLWAGSTLPHSKRLKHISNKVEDLMLIR